MPVVPSPKSHAYEVIDPFGVVEVDASNATDWLVTTDVNAAVGGGTAGAVVVTGLVTEAEAFAESVTVSFTWYVCAAPYGWVGLTPVPVVPSPKSHAYDVIDPFGVVEVDASNATDWLVTTDVNAAVGGGTAGAVVVTGLVTEADGVRGVGHRELHLVGLRRSVGVGRLDPAYRSSRHRSPTHTTVIDPFGVVEVDASNATDWLVTTDVNAAVGRGAGAPPRPVVLWLRTWLEVRALPYTLTSSMVPLR